MGPKRTYVLSVHEPEGSLVLEDVRTRRRARLTDLSEIREQIDRWAEKDPQGDREAAAREEDGSS